MNFRTIIAAALVGASFGIQAQTLTISTATIAKTLTDDRTTAYHYQVYLTGIAYPCGGSLLYAYVDKTDTLADMHIRKLETAKILGSTVTIHSYGLGSGCKIRVVDY